MKIAPEKLLEVFVRHQVTFPRSIRIKVLSELIESKYIEEKKRLLDQEKAEPNSMSIKEYIRLSRLNQYSILSEFQLENDYDYYNDANLNKVYFINLWDEFVSHLENHPYVAEVFKDLELLDSNENLEDLSVYEYNLAFASVITDEDDYFDGIHLGSSVKHFDTTSVANEIKKLGEKYSIEIPKYWTKTDMQDKLRRELKIRKMYDEDYELKIQVASKKVVCTMLDDLKVDSKMHITKADMINIIIKNVDKNKISEISIKEMAEEAEIEEPKQEAVEPIPVVIEKSPEVVEVKEVIREVENNESHKDYTYLLQQIIDNQEILMERSGHKKLTALERVFNYIVAFLIILVVILWVVFAILTF
jgi:hypothetical protein